MRLVCLALACLLSVSTTATGDHGASATGVGPDIQRLRPTQDIGRRLIEDGISQSPTFRRLVRQLSQTDVIVYVEVRHDLPWSVGGSLRFVTHSPVARYLRITINGQNSRAMMVALLGHELQHALEVAEAPAVRSAGDLRALYMRIGVRMRRDAYDSEAAQVAGWHVRAELTAHRTEMRMARRTAADEDALLGGNGSIGAP
jgi:hypothetical protein